MLINNLTILAEGLELDQSEHYQQDLGRFYHGSNRSMQLLMTNGHGMCGFIYWTSQQSGVPMKFDDSGQKENIHNLCEAAVNSKLYHKMHAHSMFTQI